MGYPLRGYGGRGTFREREGPYAKTPSPPEGTHSEHNHSHELLKTRTMWYHRV